ncbi:MAG: ZIP family metal transporter, partial [Nitrosopumilus sp.]|nr:ZIP family metal transporter [Nitrosopumilus sp.]
YNFFLSLTAGLLVFLGIDAFLESNEIAANNLAAVFNGQLLIPVIIIVTFLSLLFLSEYFTKRAESKISSQYKQDSRSSSEGQMLNPNNNSISKIKSSPKLLKNTRPIDITVGREDELIQVVDKHEIIKPLTLSLMIAIGIGLHNLGEGLAIGAAVLLGEIALSTFLIIGFTIHNTTEGLAIVAPLAKTGRLMIKRLIYMGLIAGVPTIIGTWIGGFVYTPLASIIFISIGAGAIFQVVYALAIWMSKSLKQQSNANFENRKIGEKESNTKTGLLTSQEKNPNTAIIAGFITGLLIMYITGLLV